MPLCPETARCVARRMACLAMLAALACGPAAAQIASEPAATQLTRSDVAFMTAAAHTGYAEIQSSQLALQKGVNRQIRIFAQQMLADHTQANQELAALAAAKGVQLTTEPSAMQKVKIALLSAGDGGSFDRRYASSMGVSAHKDALALFQKAATTATDADVRAYAAKHLPTLQHHLEMAQTLNDVAKAEGNVKAPHDRKQ